jgi:hypothetical protein
MSLHYWVVEIGMDLGNGNSFHVAPEEAKAIRNTIDNGIVEFISFTDLSGSPCHYRAAHYVGMYESSPEQRVRGREHSKMLEEERQDIPGVDS